MIDPNFRKRVEAMREQRAQRDKQRDEEDARRDVERYLNAFHPGGWNTRYDGRGRWIVIPSYVFLSFSCGVYLKPNGKVGWRRRWETAYPWPADRERLIDDVMARRHYCDISICPNEMRTPQRLKGNSVGLWEVHCDSDRDLPYPDLQWPFSYEGLVNAVHDHLPSGACAINSGTPGHLHVYVLMNRFSDEQLDQANHEHLCRALGKVFRADDSKISDNDMMRLPGNFNFKPLAYDPNAAPLPVTWEVYPRHGLFDPSLPTPTELRRRFRIRKVKPGSTSARGAQGSGRGSQEPTEPVDLTWHFGVKSALKRRTETGDPYKDTDRSDDTMRIVGACVDAGLSLPQTRWVVDRREDLRERIEARRDDDVERCFAKVTAERDEKRCEQAGLWPTPQKRRKRVVGGTRGWK